MPEFVTTDPATSGALVSSVARNNFNALHHLDMLPLRPVAQSSPDLTLRVYGAQDFPNLNRWNVLLRDGTRSWFKGGNSGTLTLLGAGARISTLVLDNTDALTWEHGASGAATGAADAGTTSQKIIDTSLFTVNDAYNGQLIRFTSGSQNTEMAWIVDTESSGAVHLDRQLTGAPSAGNTFSIYTPPTTTATSVPICDVFALSGSTQIIDWEDVSYPDTTNSVVVRDKRNFLGSVNYVPILGGSMAGILDLARGADLSSASSLTLGTDGNYFHVTGTTNITAISTRQAGCVVALKFDGALTLTHNSTSLILQDNANYTTVAGDVFTFVSEGSGNWRELGRRLVTGTTSAWKLGPGTPVYATPSTFTVTGDQSEHYYAGRVLRYKDTAGGSAYQYTMIKSYSSGTITVIDGGLDSGLNNVQAANFEPIKMTFAMSGRLPSVSTNNLSGRMRVGTTVEPICVDFWVEVKASTNSASSGNTAVGLRSGTDPTANGGTDVLAATNLAYNASESLQNNPTHTALVVGTYLQVDMTGAPTGGQADHLTLIMHGCPKWAQSL